MDLMTYFTWTPLEIAANFMTAICIFLAGRNNVHTWWTGIIGTGLFGVLFFNAQLYADATLQAFFLVTGFIGWFTWVKGKADTGPLVVNWAPTDSVMKMAMVAIIVAAVYGYLLNRFTDAYAPWIDSLVLTSSVVAQLLLMRRSVQTWHIWIFVNTLSVPLFWSRELYLTSILYAFFWVNAVVSLRLWTKISKEAESAV